MALRDSDVGASLATSSPCCSTGPPTTRLAWGGEDLKALERRWCGTPDRTCASIGIARYEHEEHQLAVPRPTWRVRGERAKAGYSVYDPPRRTPPGILTAGPSFVAGGGGSPPAVPSEDGLAGTSARRGGLGAGAIPAAAGPPSEFIPFAEQTGYISAITRWVVSHAIAQCGEWHRAGMGIRVSVNISARDLRQEDALVQHVAAALAEAELPAGMLCLEITESGLMDDPRSAQSALRKLRGLVSHLDATMAPATRARLHKQWR